MRIFGILVCALVGFASGVLAQDLRVATVTRAPFSMVEDGQDVGFSIDLWASVMTDLGQSYEFIRADSFKDMLDMVSSDEADAAIANISITAEREAIVDFSQPIFASGLQIMTPFDSGSPSVWSALFSRDVLLGILAAFGVLFAAGMLMWRFERGRQPYFDGNAREMAFPAFWWALNLVVNGGFEERAPRSPFGRLFGVLLVVSSLFVVSIFVAKITTSLTISAIQSNVTGINDLYDKRVGTIGGSTAAGFLERRDLRAIPFDGLEALIDAFEAGDVNAVVFDAPILAYYVTTDGAEIAKLAGPVFLPESYGIALQSGSPLAEEINQSLLRLRENGTYEAIRLKWFGPSNG
ncbi:MAG: transporter substrate-binding domain-containing protein [Octadecabacter sp.]